MCGYRVVLQVQVWQKRHVENSLPPDAAVTVCIKQLRNLTCNLPVLKSTIEHHILQTSRTAFKLSNQEKDINIKGAAATDFTLRCSKPLSCVCQAQAVQQEYKRNLLFDTTAVLVQIILIKYLKNIKVKLK